jgi:hypothetical protein
MSKRDFASLDSAREATAQSSSPQGWSPALKAWCASLFVLAMGAGASHFASNADVVIRVAGHFGTN